MIMSKYKDQSNSYLLFVSSGPFSEPHCVHESETNDEKKSLTAYKNKQYVKEVGGETKTNTFRKVPYQYKPFVLYQKDVFIIKWFLNVLTNFVVLV